MSDSSWELERASDGDRIKMKQAEGVAFFRHCFTGPHQVASANRTSSLLASSMSFLRHYIRDELIIIARSASSIVHLFGWKHLPLVRLLSLRNEIIDNLHRISLRSCWSSKIKQTDKNSIDLFIDRSLAPWRVD